VQWVLPAAIQGFDQEMDVLDEVLAHGEVTWVTDPELLLPGEDPASEEIRDAIHWVQVYGELIGMTSALLERSEPTVRGMHEDAAHEAGGTQRVLRAQRQHYEARYDFWRERASALSSTKG
jgi:ketosteroid isomerase-like protein